MHYLELESKFEPSKGIKGGDLGMVQYSYPVSPNIGTK